MAPFHEHKLAQDWSREELLEIQFQLRAQAKSTNRRKLTSFGRLGERLEMRGVTGSLPDAFRSAGCPSAAIAWRRGSETLPCRNSPTSKTLQGGWRQLPVSRP